MTERQGTDMSKLAWQSQPIDPPQITLTFIHHHASKLNAQLRREKQALYGTIVVGSVVTVAALLLRAPTMSTAMIYVTSLGLMLAIAGFIYVAMQAQRRSSRVALRPEESVAASLNAYRTELQRRRDYYHHSWRWSIGPLLPALAMFLIGGFWFDPRPESGLRYGLAVLIVIVVPLLGVLHHRSKAKAFQEELDAVDTLERR